MLSDGLISLFVAWDLSRGMFEIAKKIPFSVQNVIKCL